ncbi:hypothetical protein CTAM01_01263, partial [Colletotrichum tamarilloi]
DRCSSTALNWLDLPTSLAFAPSKPYTSDLQTQAHPNPPQQKSKASGVKIVQRCGPWYAAGKGAGSLGSSPYPYLPHSPISSFVAGSRHVVMLIFCRAHAYSLAMPQVKTAVMTPKGPRRKESSTKRPQGTV